MNDCYDLAAVAWHHKTVKRLGRAVAVLVMSMTAAGSVGAAPGSSVSEAQLESAFLYSFTRFVEWPIDRFADAAEPIVLGVLGDSMVQKELEAVVKGRKVNGREFVVRRVVTATEVRKVHVVFVAVAEDSRFAAIWPGIQDGAVLAVGESSEFLAIGGAIRFVRQEDRLRFEINVSAADRARLKISSQLQKLATVVHRDP